ncbi:MAG: NUDIX hydrolase [Faunusvirus sp.]|uniref:NUDIX hydrolase n=1 Tax=Faunusvirus sp. TaxID=2487766 RepID=A0A3G4ZXG7_9VIRU|nr:MAG: NUDIX hydrolase [Faunusvirus sp.]
MIETIGQTAALNILNTLDAPVQDKPHCEKTSKYIKTFSTSATSLFCGNCGKYGHMFKKCTDPVTSSGIITFKIDYDNIKQLPQFTNIDKSTDIYSEYLNSEYITRGYSDAESCSSNFIDYKNINIVKMNNKSYNSLQYIHLFRNKIKFLMIRRKNTLGYMEFIRGRWDLDDANGIKNLFEQMIKDEIKLIATTEFKQLWDDLWRSSSNNKTYEHEFDMSRDKFYKLKNSTEKYNLEYFTDNIKPIYDVPEWGFPKGRRNYHEKNIDCAQREFAEETDFTYTDFKLLRKLYPLNEIFTGTNGILYKHVYFLAMCDNDKVPKINPKNKSQFNEIGDIGWFTYTEAFNKIRPYHTERKRILNELFIFIIDNLIKHKN